MSALTRVEVFAEALQKLRDALEFIDENGVDALIGAHMMYVIDLLESQQELLESC